MAIGLRQGDVVSVFAIVQKVEGGRAHIRIEGAAPDAPEIDLDSTQAIIVRRSVHKDDDVIYNGEAGWKVLMLPEPGVFVIKPIDGKPGDASSYRVASSSEIRHAADPQTTPREAPQAITTVSQDDASQEAPVDQVAQAPAPAAESPASDTQVAGDQAPAPAAIRFPIEESDADSGIHAIARRALDSRANPRDRDMPGTRRPDSLEQAAGSIMEAGSVEVVSNPIPDPADELVLKPTDRV